MQLPSISVKGQVTTRLGPTATASFPTTRKESLLSLARCPGGGKTEIFPRVGHLFVTTSWSNTSDRIAKPVGDLSGGTSYDIQLAHGLLRREAIRRAHHANRRYDCAVSLR
jgi:hypothetical protein